MQIRKKVDWNPKFKVAKPQNPGMIKNPKKVGEPRIPLPDMMKNSRSRVVEPKIPDMMKNPKFNVVEPQIPPISKQVH